MKKEELKKAFEKNFEKICVSSELKTKTLNAINTSQAKKTSHLPYLKNFAAIFVVTLLCVSIYYTKSPVKKEHSYNSNKVQDEEFPEGSDSTKNTTFQLHKSIQSSEVEESILESSPSALYGNILVDDFISETSNTPSMDALSSAIIKDTKEKSFAADSVRAETAKSITETEFLNQHPDAEKIENGYIVYENDKETLYIFKNNKLENIIIID